MQAFARCFSRTTSINGHTTAWIGLRFNFTKTKGPLSSTAGLRATGLVKKEKRATKENSFHSGVIIRHHLKVWVAAAAHLLQSLGMTNRGVSPLLSAIFFSLKVSRKRKTSIWIYLSLSRPPSLSRCFMVFVSLRACVCHCGPHRRAPSRR